MRKGKTALVLSGGGMFGAYQAGVWEALDEAGFQPDIVVGASVGALNGWLVASGCPGPELARRWREIRTNSEIRWKMPRRLHEGLLDTSGLEELIRQMYCECQPQTEFGIVLTELRKLRPALFRWPEIDWRHIAASCAVPLFLPAHKIEGVTWHDGGLIDPLPLAAALEMGATRLITVDLLAHRPPLLRAFQRMLGKCIGQKQPCASHTKIVEINPSQPLGKAVDSMYWSEANTEKWIGLGRMDARRALSTVIECLRWDNGGLWEGHHPGKNMKGCLCTEYTG